ncbi:MAG TPA: hypothetical protein VFD58_25520 [Blastocatellia bacterium]|nr:hypothetical protein [Blastocatellia bacterium]
MNKLMRTFVQASLMLAAVSYFSPSFLCQPATILSIITSPAIFGTWKGESICVGNRPACKNEVVVYRFEAVAGKPEIVLLLADKIINGKRVPMGKLEFRYDDSQGELSGEFTKGQTHGLWQFKVTGGSIEGTLVVLPDRELVRRVNVKRVREDEVPAPPAKESYEGE